MDVNVTTGNLQLVHITIRLHLLNTSSTTCAIRFADKQLIQRSSK